MAADSVSAVIQTEIVVAPLAAAASIMSSPLLALAALVPFLLLLFPEMALREKVVQRREGVERDLPLFTVFASVLGGAGLSLYEAMDGIAGGGVFPSMTREALLARRDVEVFGMNANESLERLAANQPSEKFGDFLAGYTSKARSGGDVAGYLAGEGGALLRGLEEEWTRYVERVGIIGSMMITVFGVVPLLLMVVGVFSPGFSIVGLVFFTGVGVPLFTVGLVYLAGRMQPMREDAVHGSAAKSIAISLPSLSLALVFGQAWVGVAAALLVFSSAYGLSVRGQLAENRATERGIAQFLKDLLEYKRQDYDLARAVVAIEAENRYNPYFDRILAKVATQLRAGVPLDAVKVECRSRLGRMTFLLLGEMSRSGGGTVDTVYQISSLADRMNRMRQDARAEMKPYLILSYVSPLLLAFGVTFVGGILSSFSSRVGEGLISLRSSGIGVGALPSAMYQVSDLLIVVSAAALGAIGAKITDLTVRNTLRASLNVVIAVTAIVVMGGLGSHSLVQLFQH
jgi:pilus assembly protein TadC